MTKPDRVHLLNLRDITRRTWISSFVLVSWRFWVRLDFRWGVFICIRTGEFLWALGFAWCSWRFLLLTWHKCVSSVEHYPLCVDVPPSNARCESHIRHYLLHFQVRLECSVWSIVAFFCVIKDSMHILSGSIPLQFARRTFYILYMVKGALFSWF